MFIFCIYCLLLLHLSQLRTWYEFGSIGIQFRFLEFRFLHTLFFRLSLVVFTIRWRMRVMVLLLLILNLSNLLLSRQIFMLLASLNFMKATTVSIEKPTSFSRVFLRFFFIFLLRPSIHDHFRITPYWSLMCFFVIIFLIECWRRWLHLRLLFLSSLLLLFSPAHLFMFKSLFLY